MAAASVAEIACFYGRTMKRQKADMDRTAKADLHPKVLLEGCRIFEEFKGALTEQFVAQQLKASERELFYYSTENSSGEID